MGLKNYIFILVPVIGLLACGRYTIDRLQTVSYIYKNQSGKDLTLELYNVQGQVFKQVEILQDSSLLLYTSQVEGPAFFYFDSSTDRIANSILVRFDGNRCITYDRDTAGEIFQLKAYQNHQAARRGEKEYSLYYLFTLEEYNKASDCK